jgi:hypothetical protein
VGVWKLEFKECEEVDEIVYRGKSCDDISYVVTRDSSKQVKPESDSRMREELAEPTRGRQLRSSLPEFRTLTQGWK